VDDLPVDWGDFLTIRTTPTFLPASNLHTPISADNNLYNIA
jgi:hypothetical protein